ncbi:MAG: 4Fe-4S binding protein [Anaerolineales bacterium]|nr:4Fe-4S binding protein [Anaerolineales bacterium]
MILQVNQDNCTGCGECIDICTENAIGLKNGIAVINQQLCTGCELCMDVCPTGAIFSIEEPAKEVSLVEHHKSVSLQRPVLSPIASTLVPLIGTALIYFGRELLPRITDILSYGLNKKSNQKFVMLSNSSRNSINVHVGRPHRMRCRKRYGHYGRR